ncbi:hypothetical protein HMPREF9477_01555 [Lachnospiraceae bacterium 2_1_46FAA]|nr:hypothetical protein HMPREF9477_01555 [Lachnospiraceae bacterium 2_1_46FAA]
MSKKGVRKMKKSPKKWGILLLAILVIAVCSILVIAAMKFDPAKKNTKQDAVKEEVVNNENNEKSSDNQVELVSVNLDQIKEKIESKESFFVVITNQECPYCEELYEILDEYKPNEKVQLYDLNFEDFSYDREKVKEVFPSFVGTPNMFYVEDGTIISQYDNMDGDLTVDLFGRWIEKYYKK